MSNVVQCCLARASRFLFLVCARPIDLRVLHENVVCLQFLLLGGLFAQFSADSSGAYVINQASGRLLPAVQMAIDRVNNKTDGFFDELLPNTLV